MARHTSPPGTYERIWKHVLEDPSLTDAEFRLALYLATKPDPWDIHPDYLAGQLGRTRYWVDTALRGLTRRGLVGHAKAHGDGGRFARGGDVRRLARDLVVAPDGEGQGGGHHDGVIRHRGTDQAKRGKTAGRDHDGGIPRSGNPPPIVTTETPSDDLSGQDQERRHRADTPLTPPSGQGLPIVASSDRVDITHRPERSAGQPRPSDAPDRYRDQGQLRGLATSPVPQGAGQADGRDGQVKISSDEDEERAGRLAVIAAGVVAARPELAADPVVARYLRPPPGDRAAGNVTGGNAAGGRG